MTPAPVLPDPSRWSRLLTATCFVSAEQVKSYGKTVRMKILLPQMPSNRQRAPQGGQNQESVKLIISREGFSEAELAQLKRSPTATVTKAWSPVTLLAHCHGLPDSRRDARALRTTSRVRTAKAVQPMSMCGRTLQLSTVLSAAACLSACSPPQPGR